VTAASQRAALDAVHSARPIVARLSIARDKEDLAADIIEAWGAVETGLRSLVGGSALTGQMLIRELRQRQFLSLEQANSLAEFHAARERAGRTDYAPTEGDVNSVRDAFLKLESGLMGDTLGGAPTAPMPAARVSEVAAAPVPVAAPASTPVHSRPAWLIPALGALALVVVVGLAWYLLAGRGSSAAFDDGVVAYREGRREAALGSFRKAATDNPNDPMPHVYIARIERELGNMTNANTEAVQAVKLGPENGTALRELAATLFAAQNFDGARTFYIRAIKADSSDRVAQGFLGCSLIRLGRIDEGVKWIGRAGTGAWTACAPAPGTIPPQQMGPGAPRP
jgi:cytochrome c-type biogenesis protein CcmH/NrfG